jgi:hypothetical protein
VGFYCWEDLWGRGPVGFICSWVVVEISAPFGCYEEPWVSVGDGGTTSNIKE